MKPALTIGAPAKINWLLRVLDRRPDGYHDIETIFQTITLQDTLRITPADRFAFRCDDPSVPSDETNLAARAVRLMSERFSLPPVQVELIKTIPAGGGLGGGSSDAAAALRGLLELFEIHGSEEELEEIGLAVGSDVPFFLIGGRAYATGRGEYLQPLDNSTRIPLLLAIPGQRVSTAEAYRWLDEKRHRGSPVGLDRIRAIVADGLLSHAGELTNDFETVVFERVPFLEKLKSKMLQIGALWAGMSGSGSTIVGAFSDIATRDNASVTFGRDIRIISVETSSTPESQLRSR